MTEALTITLPVSNGTPPAPAPAPATPAPTTTAQQVIVEGQPLTFEGSDVATVVLKLAGKLEVDLEVGQVVELDDVFRVVAEFRVIKVHHDVDKDGLVVRTQVATPRGTLNIVPWNTANPNDTGIARARP